MAGATARIVAAAVLLGACGRLAFDPCERVAPDAAEEILCAVACAAPQVCGGGGTPGVCGASYYVDPTGSDAASGLAPGDAWATFARALPTLLPGDALILRDGVYVESLDVTLGGMPGAPIRIRAETEGGAILHGGGVRQPCRVRGAPGSPITDVVVEGLRCRYSSSYVFGVVYAQRVSVLRTTAHESNVGSTAIGFYVSQSTDVLLEDVAIWGESDNLIQVLDSDRTTLRRCWGRWQSSQGPYANIVLVSGSSDVRVENCIASVEASPGSVNVIGFGVGPNESTGRRADRNVLYGSIAYGPMADGYVVSSDTMRFEGTRVTDSLAIGTDTAVFQRGDADLRFWRMTFAETADAVVRVGPQAVAPKDADFELRGDVRDSVFHVADQGFSVTTDPMWSPYVTAFTHTYNNLSGVVTYGSGTSADPTETGVDPAFPSATYGKGSYLVGSAALATAGEAGGRLGASVLYRSQDGVLTDIPLWPWPMEQRILAEAGASVTWEDGGGLWRTLDAVYPEPEEPGWCP